jgi:hypothetical protein
LVKGNAPRLEEEVPAHDLTCFLGFANFIGDSFKPMVADILEDTRPFTGKEAIYNTFDQGTITIGLNTEGDNIFTLKADTIPKSLKRECKLKHESVKASASKNMEE